jgi:lipopolysaccharide transport system permease protein
MKGFLKPLWAYRGFIYGSVKREFQSKYKNSLLGGSWTVLNPLAMILVYTIIFSQVMRAKLPGIESGYAYSIYLCAGLLTWGLFAEIVGRGQSVFIENANLLKKISFPRMCLPIITILNASLNFAIIFALFLVFLIIIGFWPGWIIITLIPILIVQILLAIGLGITLGVLNVFFRDVGQFFGIFLQFWFWLTPIVYPATILPESIKSVMLINPMFPIIQAYQGVFVQGATPDFIALLYPLILGLGLCALGFNLFRKHVGEMVDEL